MAGVTRRKFIKTAGVGGVGARRGVCRGTGDRAIGA